MTAKRVFDLFLTVPGLVCLAPVLFCIALVIKLDDRGPVFYRQVRVGRHGKDFRIWKFRTMVPDADRKGRLLTTGTDSRITRAGRFLRRTKLDELPQLLNVLRGEMSLVGPRPEVRKYVDLYSREQRSVLDLMPGLTDVASIKYRNENDVLSTTYGAYDPEDAYVRFIMPDKIRLNLAYAEHATLLSDVRTILRTVTCA